MAEVPEEQQVADGGQRQAHGRLAQEEVASTSSSIKSDCLYSDQQNIDTECEKLLRNAKKQVKRMMEEAVTKKFIHEESSSIISLCVAVDACLSHGLKRRALGLFKTSSSTALIQKVSKNCRSAQEVLDTVEEEERKALSEQQQQQQRDAKATGNSQQQASDTTNGNTSHDTRAISQKLSIKRMVASNIGVHKRNKWIKVALIEKKLVPIVEHLAQNAGKYYEPEALMSTYLCAQILSSLLVGPSALEFSRSKTNDYYQFEDPSADELLKRHKLANPIACLCSRELIDRRLYSQQPPAGGGHLHSKLSRSATETLQHSSDVKRPQCRQTNSYSLAPDLRASSDAGGVSSLTITSDDLALNDKTQEPRTTDAEWMRHQSARSSFIRKDSRRKPLALKTNSKRGTIVTDCHHYSCQEISEHHRTKGYSFLFSSSSASAHNSSSATTSTTTNSLGETFGNKTHAAASSSSTMRYHHEDWSPRMLHETLHQNSKSNLLYAKNNVLLETQPNETMAGYLSLHQTNSDLILKWIPNQMINGSQQPVSCSGQCSDMRNGAGNTGEMLAKQQQQQPPSKLADRNSTCCPIKGEQPMAVESSYLDLVVSLSVSRIVLLHCQFRNQNIFKILAEFDSQRQQTTNDDQEVEKLDRGEPNATEETLILVEADGTQRAPFRFPKGGLRLFLSCLESGLMPDKYLDPAIKIHDNDSLDPLQSPAVTTSDWLRSPISRNGFDIPAHTADETSPTSRFDSLLKRLPSLKRRVTSENSLNNTTTTTTTTNESRGNSPENQITENGSCNDTITHPPFAKSPKTDNYVYRIVSSQQPDWPLPTPPHSALSVGCGSSSSSSPKGNIQGGSSLRQQVANISSSGQKFRWSLSRLARFSTRYTNSGSSSTSSMHNSTNQANDCSSMSSLSYNQQATVEDNSMVDSYDSTLDTTLSRQIDGRASKRDNSSNLARIEAKLDDLKKSASEEILALRTQSIQTLCESMRKQIVARAFYGWLAHCRRVRIIRAHLVNLIHDDDKCCLIDHDDSLKSTFELALTCEKWRNLLRNERELEESQMRVEINQLVYYGGLEDNDMRREVWPYLLGHYDFTDDHVKRQAKDDRARNSYESCGREWIKIERVVKQRDNELLAANMAKASRLASNRASGRAISETSNETSTLTTDSNLNNCNDNKLDIVEDHESDSMNEQQPSLGANEEPLSLESGFTETVDELNTKKLRTKKTEDNKMGVSTKRHRRRYRLESTGSVGSDASITDQYGNNIHRIDKDVQRCDRNYWYFRDTKNLEKLRNVMCTYVWNHLDIGYVQGMCDLAAPFLVIFDDEIMAYNCFSQLMKRMESNFPHGCAMDQHFESLKHLIQILDPKLFDILQSNELAYEDVFKVWETIWSARVVATDNFVVFLALAMVRYYRDIIIENNMDFTDTIKFFNEMAERHDAKRITALARDCIVELKSLIKRMEL